MNDYITKPVSPQALAEALHRWLNHGINAAEDQVSGHGSSAFSESGLEPGGYVFDRAGMMARLMDDEELARTVTESFLKDMPLQLDALKGYIERGDTAGAERQAHSIKGASANVSGEAMRMAALEIESAAGSGDLESLRTLLAGLEEQFGLLREAIKKEF